MMQVANKKKANTGLTTLQVQERIFQRRKSKIEDRKGYSLNELVKEANGFKSKGRP